MWTPTSASVCEIERRARIAVVAVAKILDIEGLVEYPDACELDYDDDGFRTGVVCGGRLWENGGTNWYNGNYNCYTLNLVCEFCGPYEVECV